ncbi:MAG: discoidin domain-containing protein [Bacteroidales bacterium]|jgi:hypothetical protein|nr:discoidin domain-containing protein [Bacteroidales bacterium]
MKKIILMLTTTLIAGSCAKMNDKHDEFLARGETVYIGKVDSVRYYPGKNSKLLFRYWISDPRAKKMIVSWGVNDTISKTLTIPAHKPADALEALFDSADGITEGNHTFHWVSWDDLGNKSMVFETLASAYGDLYQEKLLNRRVTNTDVNEVTGDITVTWGNASSTEELGVEVYYTTRNNEPVTVYYPKLGNSSTLENVDYTEGITYTTLYVPAPTAIDTFFTSIARMPVRKIINVALNKPVIAGSVNAEAAEQQAVNAVDGNHTASSSTPRWVSAANGPHTLEIDLQGTYEISSVGMWNGSSGNYSNPVTITLQAWIDDAWKDVHVAPNVTQYTSEFPPVTTGKVRLVGAGQVRLYEVEVYSIITY